MIVVTYPSFLLNSHFMSLILTLGPIKLSIRCFLGFPRYLRGKESVHRCRNCRKQGFDPWLGRSLRRGNCNPLQYSFQDNSMDRAASQATVLGLRELDTTGGTEQTLKGFSMLGSYS